MYWHATLIKEQKENYEVDQNEFTSALNEAIMRVFTRHGLNTEKLY